MKKVQQELHWGSILMEPRTLVYKIKMLIIQLIKSLGPNEAPLLIFKSKGQDQMITGLSTANSEPFLMTYEKDRKRRIHFGSYEDRRSV